MRFSDKRLLAVIFFVALIAMALLIASFAGGMRGFFNGFLNLTQTTTIGTRSGVNAAALTEPDMAGQKAAIIRAAQDYAQTERGKRRGRKFFELAFLVQSLTSKGVYLPATVVKDYFGEPDEHYAVTPVTHAAINLYYYDDSTPSDCVVLLHVTDGKVIDVDIAATSSISFEAWPTTVPSTTLPSRSYAPRAIPTPRPIVGQ